MPFLLVPLATDVLLWLLIFAVVAYAWYCRRRAHLAAPWKRVFQAKAAMICSVILGCYLLIGLADSLHFRVRLASVEAASGAAYSPEVLSVLDLATWQLRERREKSYSAPLATRLYAKEQIELPDGKTAREYPRLRFGGAHLADEADWAGDIVRKIGTGLVIAALAGALVFLGAAVLERRHPQVPWRAAGMTLAVMLAVAIPAALLARGYHVLGTDKVGQDVLYQSLKSMRVR